MHKSVGESILTVCNALKKFQVEYLIVGGTAVALYGYFRWSYTSSGELAEKFDLDIWYNPTYDNYFRLLNALEHLGQNVDEFRDEQAPNPRRSFFKLELEKFSLDFLPELKELSKFKPAFEKKEVIQFEGIDLFVISFDDLIKDKESNARPQDLEDIKHLKERKNLE